MNLRFTTLLILCAVFAIFYANAEQKFVTVALNKATSKRAGTLGQPLTSYYTHFNIGTPSRPFKLLIDIESSETWLPHKVTFGGIFFRRLHYDKGYSKKTSSSGVKEEREVTFEYQGCKLDGKPYEDVVAFGNSIDSNNEVSVKQQFLAISSASNDRFSDLYPDGVLGLHPKNKSEAGLFSIVVSLIRDKLIDKMVFSLSLNSDEGSESGGEITFGGINSTKYRSDIRYHRLLPLVKRWEVPLQSALLGAQVVSCYPAGCAVSFSTGVGDIYGPPSDVERIMDLLGVSNKKRDSKSLNAIDCLRVNDLPTLTFNIDGVAYKVPPKSYVRHSSDGVACYVAILPGDSDFLWTLGTYFLENYYSVFDSNTYQVGFAEKNDL